MPIRLSEPYVLLCEGEADKEFFKRLIEAYKIPSFSIITCEGTSKITERLLAILADGIGFSKVRGILIAVDAASVPSATFQHVTSMVKNASGFPIQSEPSKIATAGVVSLSITLVPDDNTPGGLESLYVDERFSAYPWLERCINTFFSCGESKTLSWSAEKLAKAKFACIVGSQHRSDPSRAASLAVKSPAVVDILAPQFRGMADRLRQFISSLPE